MANAPLPKMAGGYPSFGSQNANELIVTPSGLYVWNGSVWVPAMADVNGNQNVVISGSDILQPVDVQSHLATTIQTHNAVSVPASGWSDDTVWRDSNGFVTLAGSVLNDGTTSMTLQIKWSNDGVNYQGLDSSVGITGNSARYAAFSTPVKARYFKLTINNGDATLAHTMSAWAYLIA